jgi:hypothetical protein
VDAKRSGWQSGENNARECGNPQNSADLSHDQAPLEAPRTSEQRSKRALHAIGSYEIADENARVARR